MSDPVYRIKRCDACGEISLHSSDGYCGWCRRLRWLDGAKKAGDIDGIDRTFLVTELHRPAVNPDRHARIRAKHFHRAFLFNTYAEEMTLTALLRRFSYLDAFDACDWGTR